MDYGFVPGGTRGAVEILNYFEWRTGSSTIVDPPDFTLQSFVDALRTSGSVQRPVNDLGIGCHGSGYGILELQLDASSPALAFFNDVQQVEARGTIKIPSAVLDPRPVLGGVEIAAFFRIVGCEIGQARPYLERLKAALGGQVFIIASPHIQALAPLSFANGLLRYLVHAFSVTAATAFQNRADLVEAFDLKQPKFRWYDGTPVPRSFWEAMVPTDIAAVGEAHIAASLNYRPPIGTSHGPSHGVLENDAGSWLHILEPVGPFKVDPPADPAFLVWTDDARRSFARQAIKSKPEFASGHPFPLYRQRGYASFDAFIDGFDWLAEPNNYQLLKGVRHVYRLTVPVGKPPSVVSPPRYWALEIELPFYDFVTPSGTGNQLGLSETDPLLFTIV